MKHNHLLLLFAIITLAVVSCKNDNTTAPVSPEQADTIVTQVPHEILTDSMVNELRLAHKRSMDLYSSELFNKYAEYVYPAYFDYLKRRNHYATTAQAKAQYVDMLVKNNENFWEQKVSVIAPQAQTYGFTFSHITDTASYQGNLLLTYSQLPYYFTGKDTIRNATPGSGLAIYLARKSTWYFLDVNIPHIKEILRQDFDNATINRIINK